MGRLHPQRALDVQRQRLEDRSRRMAWTMRRALDRRLDWHSAALASLAALNPLRVLARGYSIVQNMQGAVITDPAQTQTNEELRVRASGGEYRVARK
jgi:exodeoxyribonuclease VII large subunit